MVGDGSAEYLRKLTNFGDGNSYDIYVNCNWVDSRWQ